VSVPRFPQAAPYLLPIARDALLTVSFGEQEVERGDEEPAAAGPQGHGEYRIAGTALRRSSRSWPWGRTASASAALSPSTPAGRRKHGSSSSTRTLRSSSFRSRTSAWTNTCAGGSSTRPQRASPAGRAPLAATTLQGYRINVERHLIPALGHKRVGQLTVRDLDASASGKLAAGYAPSTVNRIRETLRSALSAAVRQDPLTRNVARYGGGVGAAPPPVDRFSDEELGAILRAASGEHYYPIILLLARTGLRTGEACGLRWRDVTLRTSPPRLTVVWQLDKWGQVVDPKSPTSRRTIPLREEVVTELVRWRKLQKVWADRLGEHFVNQHGLVFTTRTGRPISKRNIARSFERVRKAAGVEHGTLKTLRSTVATQLAEGGLHPRKAQTFLGHAHMSTTMKYYTAVSDVDDAAALLPDLTD
jgi:integrase